MAIRNVLFELKIKYVINEMVGKSEQAPPRRKQRNGRMPSSYGALDARLSGVLVGGC